MKIHTTILIISTWYLLMLLTIVLFKRKSAGTTFRAGKFEWADLKGLNYLHMVLISLMLAASCTVGPLPQFLMEFPDRITIAQFAAFLITFGTISFIPWKKLNRATTVEEEFPQISAGLAVQYSFLRIAFLVAYEWFFRGLLLMSFSVWLGIKGGVTINIVLYTLLHVHKNKKEVLGCIPFGLLLCVFTIWWQSIWPAIIFHVQLATLNEWPLLQRFISLQKQNAL